jgi:SAM-dependent methyltransferase
MPSIRWNRYWGRSYDWSADGEEWSGQAAFCGQPYEAWKASLVDAFLRPMIGADDTVLEIAPGHGRWSAELIDLARTVHLVDLNPECVAFCRERFRQEPGVHCHQGDGRSLPAELTGAVDAAWSYDSFVHMELDTLEAYLHELARVLRPGGRAVLHHAGRRHRWLPLGFLRHLGPLRSLYQLLSMGRDTMGGRDGDRGNVSGEAVRAAAERAGLRVLEQVDRWGPEGAFDCRRFRDLITTLERPAR